MWADTLSESDGPRSAETSSAADGVSVGAATSGMSSRAGNTICLEEDRRFLSRLDVTGLDNRSRQVGSILHSLCSAGMKLRRSDEESYQAKGVYLRAHKPRDLGVPRID